MCQNSAFTLIMNSVDIDQLPHKVATFKEASKLYLFRHKTQR